MAASMEVIHGKRVAWPASIGLITGPQPLDQAHKRRDMRRGPLGGLSEHGFSLRPLRHSLPACVKVFHQML